MPSIVLLPEADEAASALATGSWQTQLPFRGAAGDNCGSGLSGIASVLMVFVRPLEELHEKVIGDPAGLYQASSDWEAYSGFVQSASETLDAALKSIEGKLEGLAAAAAEGVLWLLAAATHALSSWTKVVSQALRVAMRAVEIMRSLVCEGYELLASVAAAVGGLAFGTWPWEVEKKAQIIRDFAANCTKIIQSVLANIDRALQALRELVRLVTDLYRAVIPFHQAIEDAIGRLIEVFPPSDIPGIGQLPGLVPSDGRFNEIENPGLYPYPGSDLKFDREFPLGYHQQYDLGASDMTTEELNELLRSQFGHIFSPAQDGDNSQINGQLTGPGQIFHLSLFGMNIPGATGGDIEVLQVGEDGFVVAARPGHPEHPGQVAFRVHSVNGRAVLEVTGAFDETFLTKFGFDGDTTGAYAGMTDQTVWSDMGNRLADMIRYGS